MSTLEEPNDAVEGLRLRGMKIILLFVISALLHMLSIFLLFLLFISEHRKMSLAFCNNNCCELLRDSKHAH